MVDKEKKALRELENVIRSQEILHTPKNLLNINTLDKALLELQQTRNIIKINCENCINRQNNICLGFDCILDIETLVNCKEYDLQNYKDGISDFVLWLKGHTYRPENLYSDIMKKLQELNLIGKEIE